MHAQTYTQTHTLLLTNIFPPGPWLCTVTPIHWFCLFSAARFSTHTIKMSHLTHAETHYNVSCFHVFELTIIVKHHSLAWLTGRIYVTVVHASRNFWLLPRQCFSFWGTDKQPVNQQTEIYSWICNTVNFILQNFIWYLTPPTMLMQLRITQKHHV